jgi:hypothetical protein
MHRSFDYAPESFAPDKQHAGASLTIRKLLAISTEPLAKPFSAHVVVEPESAGHKELRQHAASGVADQVRGGPLPEIEQVEPSIAVARAERFLAGFTFGLNPGKVHAGLYAQWQSLCRSQIETQNL